MMTRAKNLALALYFGAAAAGAVIGVTVDRTWFRTPPGADPGYYRAQFFNKLKLNAAQRDSVTQIFADRDRKLRTLMDGNREVLAPYRAQQDSILAEGRRRITQLLTVDQKAIYEQMQREQRERAQRTEKK